MTPDPATIARRRHLVTVLLRAAIVVLAAWTAWEFCTGLVDALWNLYQVGIVQPAYFVQPFMIALPRVVAVVVLLALQGRIVRWVVPMPSAEPGCPRCGYSLKNLRSPVCPECGLNLKGSAP